jgi:serine/threonine protein kinase
MSEKKTNILREKKEGCLQYTPTSDVSALHEIIRSNADSKMRKNAATRLMGMIEEGQAVDAYIIKNLFDAEKNIAVSAELKRVLNKLKLLSKFSSDPVGKFDRKLTVTEEDDLEKEISRLRNLYDKSIGEQGSFDRKYKVIAEIFEGGMGKTFRGIRISDNKPIAIKYLLLKKLSEENNPDRLIARFKREGELLTKRLKHPNIVEAFEYGEAEGEYFIVMEYVDGGTLDKMVSNQPLDSQTFKSFALQLCDAVEYIHRNDVIHRDIKPLNILLSNNGNAMQIKLVDFGLAKDKRDGKISRFSFGAGTDDYSSPQQLINATQADERDDIFSMGKTFYQMLTGRTIKGDEPYEEISKFNFTAPTGLDIIVRRCIANKKEDRFQNLSQLRESLKTI